MSKHYTHLDHRERTLIYWWLKDKLSLREIARRLQRSHTTISRELKRNQWCSSAGWFPRGAQKKYEYRLQKRAKRFRLKTPAIANWVRSKLKIGWTPEIISGRLKHFHPHRYVCPESIYQYIYCIDPSLIQYLPRKHKHRRKKHPYRTKPARIKGRNGLHLRPAAANERLELGHWESDTVVGADRAHGLNTLVERTCRMTHISLMTEKTAVQTDKVIVRRLKKYPQQYRKSITYDNGSENTLHRTTNQKLNTQSYFCEPYHSWEKGSVEHVNGLIRRFLPKGTSFKNVTASQINRIEKLLNNRPRKCLQFKTPYEVFREHRGALSC